ncbi:hypothetical protein UPYG_G00069180 [Umbra pygmaea]|uniref:Uncharacterized protein n=1 Tax=Umbra pygmaea TaxID=75934 RepID=A0ABD0XEE1_UMBPY
MPVAWTTSTVPGALATTPVAKALPTTPLPEAMPNWPVLEALPATPELGAPPPQLSFKLVFGQLVGFLPAQRKCHDSTLSRCSERVKFGGRGFEEGPD